jgi:uncharacterized iron-regulated membrane protein
VSTTRKGISPLLLAIFAIVGLVLVLATVSIIFTPAIMRSVNSGRAVSTPQPTATAASFSESIQNVVKQRIAEELQKSLSRKSNTPKPEVTATPETSPPPPPAP